MKHQGLQSIMHDFYKRQSDNVYLNYDKKVDRKKKITTPEIGHFISRRSIGVKNQNQQN